MKMNWKVLWRRLKTAMYNVGEGTTLMVIIVIILGALLILGGCASVQESAQRTGSLVVSGLPRVEFPVLSGLGITPTGQNVVLTNITPFWCQWFAYGTELGSTGPGDWLAGSKYFEPLSQQAPVVVMCFRDPGFSQYVGVAGRTFPLGGGQPIGFTWSLQASELQSPEGTNVPAALGSNHPQPDTVLAGKKIDIPRESWNGTLALQIVNNTLFTIGFGSDVANLAQLPPASLHYEAPRTLLGGGRSIAGRLIFTDRGRLVGTYDFQAGVPGAGGGVVAQQIIVSPGMIRR